MNIWSFLLVLGVAGLGANGYLEFAGNRGVATEFSGLDAAVLAFRELLELHDLAVQIGDRLLEFQIAVQRHGKAVRWLPVWR